MRLLVRPEGRAQFQVIVTRRPKYACRLCEEGIHQALAPSHLILGGIPTEATIAHVLVFKYAETILKGFNGTLQVDGYAGYNRLLKRWEGPIKLAYCWVHARRKLYEISQSRTAPIAEEGLSRITALYRIEADIRGQSASARLATRQAQAALLIAEFEQWLTQNRNQVSRKFPLGEALAYIAKYWEELILYLTDGQIEMTL